MGKFMEDKSINEKRPKNGKNSPIVNGGNWARPIKMGELPSPPF